jgi:hypothetical protein
MALQIETVAIDSILENPANTRIHSDTQLQSLAASLKRFGQRIPLVVNEKDRIILVGNGRFRAMRDILKWKAVDVVWSKLNSTEATAFSIADNQLGVISEWDSNLLSSTVQELFEFDPKFDWNTIGFSNDEVIPMLHDLTDEQLQFLSGSGEPKKEPTKEPDVDMGKAIKLTKEQRDVIDRAIFKLRYDEGDPKLSEGRCLEYIVVEWLQDPNHSFPNKN